MKQGLLKQIVLCATMMTLGLGALHGQTAFAQSVDPAKAPSPDASAQVETRVVPRPGFQLSKTPPTAEKIAERMDAAAQNAVDGLREKAKDDAQRAAMQQQELDRTGGLERSKGFVIPSRPAATAPTASGAPAPGGGGQ